jgi:hypothetical protein
VAYTSIYRVRCFGHDVARHLVNQIGRINLNAIRNFKTFCLDALTAIRNLTTAGRELTAAINNYNARVSELHADIKKIEQSVGFLYRAERYQRESNGHKVNFG